MKPLLYFFLLTSLSSFAQKNEGGILKGLVLTSDNKPAESVSIKNTGSGTTTDDKGKFEIRRLRPGTYILIVSLLDYTESEITVEVKENETVLLNVQLYRTDAQLKEVI